MKNKLAHFGSAVKHELDELNARRNNKDNVKVVFQQLKNIILKLM